MAALQNSLLKFSWLELNLCQEQRGITHPCTCPQKLDLPIANRRRSQRCACFGNALLNSCLKVRKVCSNVHGCMVSMRFSLHARVCELNSPFLSGNHSKAQHLQLQPPTRSLTSQLNSRHDDSPQPELNYGTRTASGHRLLVQSRRCDSCFVL